MKKEWLQFFESPVTLAAAGIFIVLFLGMAIGGAIVGIMTGALMDWSEITSKFGLLFAGVFGLAFAAWRARTADEQAKTAKKQAGIAEEGQFTDRFSAAVEHLGSEQLPVRLGGIYALWRLAKASPESDVVSIFDNQVCPSLQWGLDVGGSDGFSHPLHLVPAFRHPRKNVLSMLWGFIRGGRFR